jgi:[ribosomal protein S18]-alanine N-acetyltransferase
VGPLQLVPFGALTAAQWAAMWQIESACHITPWRLSELQASVPAGHLAKALLTVQDELLGYSVWMPNVDDWELLNLTVKPDQQGRGLGRHLLAQGLSDAQQSGALGVFLEVRPSNVAALALYHAVGFTTVGRRKNYYRTADASLKEDALIMRVDCQRQQPAIYNNA